MPEDLVSILPDSAQISDGSLQIGGCSVTGLAAQYGTPLYVYDEGSIRGNIRRILTAFAGPNARVSYAAKACAILGVLRVVESEGLGLDTVSSGELEAGLRAGFTPERMHLHGNFKTDEELERAVSLGVRTIVVDNQFELERLATITGTQGGQTRIMLRLALLIEAETHPYLQTAGAGAKFGTRFESAEMEDMLSMTRSKRLQLTGVHAHLGSQIADVAVFREAARSLVSIAAELGARGFPIEEVSLGGGWRVAYRPGETALEPAEVAQALQGHFPADSDLRPAIEPGRAIIASTAVAVYRVGPVKRLQSGQRLIAVDGGMGDNPRPALYQSAYTALVQGMMHAEALPGTADIVGRYCESGDVLARGLTLPEVCPGDLLVMPVAGAYQLAMASAYNLVPPPAAVMVKDGRPRLIRRRPDVQSLLESDVEDE